MEKENTTEIIIRQLLFDNFLRLTYPNKVSLNNSLIFMLKYSILVLEQDGWMFTQKTRKKILIRKVAGIIVAPTLLLFFFSLSISKHRLCSISLVSIICIINIIRYFRLRNFHKNMFLQLCSQFSN